MSSQNNSQTQYESMSDANFSITSLRRDTSAFNLDEGSETSFPLDAPASGTINESATGSWIFKYSYGVHSANKQRAFCNVDRQTCQRSYVARATSSLLHHLASKHAVNESTGKRCTKICEEDYRI